MKTRIFCVAAQITLTACGGSSQGPASSGTGGLDGSVASGGSASGGAANGGTANGGSVSGGSANGGVASGGAANGGAASGGTANGTVSCDTRKVLCRVATPSCGAMQVPSIQGTCYGPCVPIDQCACSVAEDCPDPNQYTCLASQKHCSPYLN